MLDFTGKTVLITGGTSGIGLASAEVFARQGASLVIAGRSQTKGQAAVEQLARMNAQAVYIRADVRDEAHVANMVDETLAAFGRLDVLVNSAGAMHRVQITEMEQSEWDSILDTNLRGVYLVSKYALPHIVRQGAGAVVNVASYLGVFGARHTSPAYGASKAGVVALTRSMALQVGPQGVRVNAVCPAFTVTPLNEHIILDAPDPEQKEREIAQPYPLGRLGRPLDIAAGILFLASEEASWITGTTLVIDGGLTAR